MPIIRFLLAYLVIAACEQRAQVADEPKQEGPYVVVDATPSAHQVKYAESNGQLKESNPSSALVMFLLAFAPAVGWQVAGERFGFKLGRTVPRVATRVVCTGTALLDEAVLQKTTTQISELMAQQKEADESLTAALRAIRPDPAPAELYLSKHWLISTECPPYHHEWSEGLCDLGGIMVGVGAEQNYVLAGWARPEFLVLMDFDSYVPWLHKAYGVAFEMAATPHKFISLWSTAEGRKSLEAAIAHKYDRTGEVEDILRAVKASYSASYLTALGPGAALAHLQTAHNNLEISCFLNDQEQYEFVASLWRRQRVLAIRGDLLGKRTIFDIAAFAKNAGLPVRVLYMSNAQDGFGLDDRWRDNIMALPFDSHSLVLRTGKLALGKLIGKSAWSWPKDVWFMQRGVHLKAWLECWRTSNSSIDTFLP